MFISEAKTITKIALALSVVTVSTMAGEKLKHNVDNAVIYPVKNKHYGPYAVNPQSTKGFKRGRTPTANEIKAWDVDIRPDGKGLPEGKGTAGEGEELYTKNCAMCHGDFGMGGKGYPTLSGGQGTLKNQLVHPENGDEPPVRTIGSYWPYATTLFWYIKTAMPFPHPMSLTNDQVYSLTAYLLSVNEIQLNGEDIDDDTVFDRKALLQIHMPNEKGFYPNVENGTAEVAKFLQNPANYGSVTKRCMKGCKDGKIVHIKYELKDFKPPMSTVRDLPKEKGVKTISKAQKLYEVKCKACHGNPAIGAPVLGDKEAWADRIKKGKDTLYKNAINGFNAMPPKGGNMDLPDATVKDIVDYMVESSK